MSSCIKNKAGTIGYIDMGHGHAENLQEIELLNAAQKYISTKESAAAGGILAAAENAALPSTLSGSFANVNLLNQVRNNCSFPFLISNVVPIISILFAPIF